MNKLVKYHHNQDNEHMQHPEQFPCTPLHAVSLSFLSISPHRPGNE